jgi:hypothetical protein
MHVCYYICTSTYTYLRSSQANPYNFDSFSFLKKVSITSTPARTPANVSTLLAKVTLFDANVPKYLTMSAGVYSIDVVVYDAWGASTIFTIPTTVTVTFTILIWHPYEYKLPFTFPNTVTVMFYYSYDCNGNSCRIPMTV